MLTRKTVLVLGAGASQPYNFPTGIELSTIVSDEFRPGHSVFEALKNLGYSEADMTQFREAFYHSGRNSVDAFLEHRADLLDAGKLAIAAILTPRENPEILFKYDNSWLRLLYKWDERSVR